MSWRATKRKIERLQGENEDLRLQVAKLQEEVDVRNLCLQGISQLAHQMIGGKGMSYRVEDGKVIQIYSNELEEYAQAQRNSHVD